MQEEETDVLSDKNKIKVTKELAEDKLLESVEARKKSIKQAEIEKFQTDIEKEIKQRKGLTIVGKIDLEKEKKKAKEKTVIGKAKTIGIEETVSEVEEEIIVKPVVEISAQEAEAVKKKKRKPKAKKKIKQEVTEESVVPKRKKFKRIEVDDKEVEEAIKRTMLSLDDSAVAERASLRKRKRKKKQKFKNE